jgi:hypothetical protein
MVITSSRHFPRDAMHAANACSQCAHQMHVRERANARRMTRMTRDA